MEHSKDDGLSDALRLLWHLLRTESRLATAWLVSLLASVTATLAIPIALGEVIDKGVGSVVGSGPAFVGLLLLAFALATTTSARLYFVSRLADQVVVRLQKGLFGQLIRRDLDFHGRNRSTELLSRLTTDSEYLRLMLGASISITLRGGIMATGSLGMLFATNARLASWSVLTIVLAVVPVVASGRRLRTMSRRAQDLSTTATAVAGEVLGAARTVKEFVREKHEHARYAQALDLAIDGSRRRVTAQALLAGAAIGLVFGAVVLVLWIGTREVFTSRMTPGDLGQFVLYAVIGGMAVAELLNTWGAVQRSLGAIARIAGLYRLDVDPEPTSKANSLPEATGRIAFEGVDFAYVAAPTKLVLRDFSLRISPGECVALFGRSGAGKSTVFSLLLRLFNPQRGQVLLDDLDIRTHEPDCIREQIAIVPQTPTLFAMSVRENIRYGRLDATNEEVEAAATAAEADAFIRQLPLGYDEPLGERGARLSGGQQQRIAIARAMLKDAPILLLDEATSALDAQSEEAVHLALKRLRSGRTTLIIAHRLSTLRDADYIVVMERGRVTQTGTHEELIKQHGLYAELAALQMIDTTGSCDANEGRQWRRTPLTIEGPPGTS